MKNAQRIACLLIAAACCTAFTACGRQKESVTETTTETTASVSEAEQEDEEDESDDDAPIDLGSITVRGSSTTAPAETTAPARTSAVTATTAASVRNTGSSAATTANPKSTNRNAKSTTTAATTTQTVTEASTEEKTVSGVIDLGSGSYEGEGITVDGGTIRITGSGTYILSGSRNGMVEVNTTEKVKLKLNGVNISNPDGPAILCTDAKRLTITLIEGTYNELNDGGGVHDGTITSNDTLEIKGAGTLRVNGNVGHGISSDDDIVIKNGDITVNAVKSGMMANDDITVTGGTLHVTGQTNGMKSKGTLHIEGGSMWIIGGPKENKSALHSDGAFTMTGGWVYALGCGVTEPDSGSSTQRSIAFRFSPGLDAGSTASVTGNGNQLMRESSPYAFNTVFVSTPDICDGMQFTVYGNDAQYGEEYTVSGMNASASAEKKPAEESHEEPENPESQEEQPEQEPENQEND
ncbi:MAG: carbohydrate-binding domain-containing protein [Oscillospiraceae bacterium]|nr:carbohydrate-binding domain-containing protein [Oscillospiraceae bacterium]